MPSMHTYHNSSLPWTKSIRENFRLLAIQESLGTVHLFQRKRSDGSYDYLWTMATPWSRRFISACQAGVFQEGLNDAQVTADPTLAAPAEPKRPAARRSRALQAQDREVSGGPSLPQPESPRPAKRARPAAVSSKPRGDGRNAAKPKAKAQPKS